MDKIFKLIRAFQKANGRSPTPSELAQLKKQAGAIPERGKFLQFPPGGKGGKGPTNIMEEVVDEQGNYIGNRKAEEMGLGSLRESFTKKYPPHKVSDKLGFRRKEYPAGVEPGSKFAKAIDESDAIQESKLKLRMERQNKETAERIRNKKQMTDKEVKDFADEFGIDPSAEEYNWDGTLGDAKKLLKSMKDEEAYMFQQYKAGRLDPKPGESGRKEFLQKKMQEMEMSGDKRLMTQDEIEELIGLEDFASGGRAGFSNGSSKQRLAGITALQPLEARARTENTSEKIFNKLLEVAKTLESEEQKYMYEFVIPKTLMKLSADVGTKESQAIRNFLAENPDLTKVDLSNIPLKFNDNTHLKTMLEIPLPSNIKAKVTADSSMTGSDLDKIELTSKNLDIEYDKKKNEIASDLNFDIGQGDINLSNVNYLNDNTNASRLDVKYPFKAGNLKARVNAEDGNIYRGQIGYADDKQGLNFFLNEDTAPSISAYRDFDNNIGLDADLSLDKEDLNQIGVRYQPDNNLNLFAKQDIGEGGTTIGGDYILFDTKDDVGNKSRFDIGARADLDGEKNAYFRYVKNFGLKEPGLQFQTNNPDEAIDFLSSKKNFFNSGGRAGFYFGGDVKPDMSDIGHGSDSLMARTRLVSPNGMATTSTGLNYLLAEDNDNIRIPYAKGGVAKILKE
tara:strand:+ start:598 stop:2628 length:2031 start_codon:yes stop_codon:yes gene_type:complete